MLMLAGCVQPSMMPNINSATARVLDAAGIQAVVAPDAGCCGAVKFHLNDHDGGKAQMRANIDAWWPQVEARRGRGDRDERLGLRRHGARVRPHAARTTRPMPRRRERISALTRDLSELLPELVPALKAACSAPARRRRLPPALHAAARPAAARRRRDAPARAGLRRAGGARTNRTCAAARPAPTRCCSPNWPTRCATASSAT